VRLKPPSPVGSNGTVGGLPKGDVQRQTGRGRTLDFVAMQMLAQTITNYIRAKDLNRPYLMPRAFAKDAVLEINVRTGAISFPPRTIGVDEIADVLVRQFAQTYENVHTFCLVEQPTHDSAQFVCDWLVGMSEKVSRTVRVGCGSYEWTFGDAGDLARMLTITIDVMESLPASTLELIVNWLERLPYPWCPADIALRQMPHIEQLSPNRPLCQSKRSALIDHEVRGRAGPTNAAPSSKISDIREFGVPPTAALHQSR